jgi:hypothetical protein
MSNPPFGKKSSVTIVNCYAVSGNNVGWCQRVRLERRSVSHRLLRVRRTREVERTSHNSEGNKENEG